MKGKEVKADEILLSREKRLNYQNSLIKKYNMPIISFTMNIPGPIKTNESIRKAFNYAKKELLKSLEKNKMKILELLEFYENTGDVLFIVVDGKTEKLKDIAIELEEREEIGRLFDMDVIDINFKKLSRSSFRKCLICNKQAQECGRARSHSVEELQCKVMELLKNIKIK